MLLRFINAMLTYFGRIAIDHADISLPLRRINNIDTKKILCTEYLTLVPRHVHFFLIDAQIFVGHDIQLQKYQLKKFDYISQQFL